jgi:hypothetical protein
VPQALAINVARIIRSGRVIEVLAKLVSTRGAPCYLRSANGPEFISAAVLSWVTERSSARLRGDHGAWRAETAIPCAHADYIPPPARREDWSNPSDWPHVLVWKR